MDFIFMLTRNDETVKDCLEVMELIKPLNIKHLGFKDVGVDKATLYELNKRIKETGAVSYLEVVSTTKEDCLNSAKVAVEIGIDRLLGGTAVKEILEITKNTGVEYYPFPGFPIGHPTDLGGKAKDVEEHCKGFIALGCAGADLLAYRATEDEPIELVKGARKGLEDKILIAAGSVDNVEKINDLKNAGADYFTIGTAAFNGSFSPNKGSLLSQLRDVLEACN